MNITAQDTVTLPHLTNRATTTDRGSERAALIEQELGLVYAIAARVYKTTYRNVEYNELVSLGTIGLIQAAARYDKSSGVRFATYAYRRVHGAIIDGLRKMGPLSLTAWRKQKQQPEVDAAATQTKWRRLPPVCQSTAEQQLIAKQRKRLLNRALTQLPERENFLIENCYFADRAMGEAGRDLGMSKSGTSRLHGRALQSLRKQLRGYSYESLAA